MIFVAKNNYIFGPTSTCGLFMPKCTSGELITILYLSEVFNLELCLVFFVNG
jgi:hypothetical protein